MKWRFLTLLPALLLALLSGCRYTFVPIIPPEVHIALPTRVSDASLKRDGDALVLRATLGGDLTPGYLTVVWFDADKEIGRDSVYLDAAQRQASFRLSAPDKGSYRAELLYGGLLLRQLELRETGEL